MIHRLRVPHCCLLPTARCLLLLGLLLLAGCGEDLDTKYGERTGYGEASVNGTSVLGRMFAQAGHKVRSVRALTPKLNDRADVIVWFPDDFAPPSEAVRDWFKSWLSSGSDRKLIYVGRDFDAATDYWQTAEPLAPAAKQAEFRARGLAARGEFQARRATGLPNATTDAGWFQLDPLAAPRDVRALDGESRWTDGVDPAKLGIRLNSRFRPKRHTDVWLESNGDPLVMARSGDRIILITNGSFLLNLPLVNHEHRKLAARLIDEVGLAPKQIVFLESGLNGPRISETDPTQQVRTGLEIFGIAPFSTILLQWAAVGIIFCFVRFPIFGRPKLSAPTRSSDFGGHIEALGSLLRRTRDRAFALSRLQHYQQHPQRGLDN